MISFVKNGRLTYNNGQIYYETTGSGEPIVFIHGFTLDNRMWQPQVDFFGKKYQVVTYDARGFGRSSIPSGTYNHCDDLRALLEHLGIEQAHIVGLSMGGRIAINFALAHPETVRRLVVMDSALDSYKSTVGWNVYARNVGIERAKENWMNHEIFAETRKHSRVVAALRPIVKDYSGWHWLHEDTQRPTNSYARTRLSEITAPTLIIVGEKDLAYFRTIAATIKAGIKGSVKVMVANGGHMINMEKPEIVNKLLADFIASPAANSR